MLPRSSSMNLLSLTPFTFSTRKLHDIELPTFVLLNKFQRTGCFVGMPVKFTLGSNRTAW